MGCLHIPREAKGKLPNSLCGGCYDKVIVKPPSGGEDTLLLASAPHYPSPSPFQPVSFNVIVVIARRNNPALDKSAMLKYSSMSIQEEPRKDGVVSTTQTSAIYQVHVLLTFAVIRRISAIDIFVLSFRDLE